MEIIKVYPESLPSEAFLDLPTTRPNQPDHDDMVLPRPISPTSEDSFYVGSFHENHQDQQQPDSVCSFVLSACSTRHQKVALCLAQLAIAAVFITVVVVIKPQ